MEPLEFLKHAKLLVDLGVTALVLAGLFVLVMRPPRWIHTAVDSHHALAAGVETMGRELSEGVRIMGRELGTVSQELRSLPRREEMQELLIGQEALRRETREVKEELTALRGEINGRSS